jgi:hypothetical protein
VKDFFDKWAPHFGSGILARLVLALLFSGGYVYMSVTGIEPSSAYVAIMTAVVGWFFSSQAAEKAEERLQAQQREVVELARQLPPESVAPRS